MSKDATLVAESVEVAQADREAAADLFCEWFVVVPHASVPTNMRCGNKDDHEFVVAFARHRLAAYEAGRAEGVRAAAEVADALKYRAEHIALERCNAGEDMGAAVAASLIYGKAADHIRALSKEPTK